jgi:hypothetical protein
MFWIFANITIATRYENFKENPPRYIAFCAFGAVGSPLYCGWYFFMNRKAFNFYKSYYDVAIELPDDERNEFVWSIVSAQFTGSLVEPKSKLARLMFLSQKHSILKQLEGFKFATEGPPEGAHKGSPKGPYQQVQEKEQEQVQEQVKVYGTPSSLSFGVTKKFLHENACKVYDNGLKDYCNKHQMGFWFKKDYMSELFWKDNSGKMFNDHSHVNNVLININNNKNG